MFPALSQWISLYIAPIPTPEAQSYATTFVYRRLPSNTRCFRVFHLTPLSTDGGPPPGNNNPDGVLCGRLTAVNLDDSSHPPYNALSYCWEGSIEPSPYSRQSKDRILVQDTDGITRQLLS